MDGTEEGTRAPGADGPPGGRVPSLRAEITHTNRPSLRRYGGEQPPRWISLAEWALGRAPGPARALLIRLASRVLPGHLPALIASYPDGRRFRIPAGDRMYAQILIYGAYEPAESATLGRLLRPGDFAIDVGANHGWFSVLMGAGVGPEGRVWAIEPVPPLLGELRENLALNPTVTVDVIPLAVGDRSGTVQLHVFAGLVHGHASTSTLGRDDYVEYAAELRPLDDLLDAQAEQVPAVVKLDVEGAERSVIQGAAKLIAAPVPPIWMMEVNVRTARAFGYRPAELLEPFREDGRYTTYRIASRGLVHDRDPASAPHGTTWLCVPEAHSGRVAALVVS
jgi:FkbM family methyltransferase